MNHKPDYTVTGRTNKWIFLIRFLFILAPSPFSLPLADHLNL